MESINCEMEIAVLDVMLEQRDGQLEKLEVSTRAIEALSEMGVIKEDAEVIHQVALHELKRVQEKRKETLKQYGLFQREFRLLKQAAENPQWSGNEIIQKLSQRCQKFEALYQRTFSLQNRAEKAYKVIDAKAAVLIKGSVQAA